MNGKILLIDDDEEFTNDLAFLLNGSYKFVAVTKGKKGIELLEKEKFDLVVLDLVMPAFYAEEDEKEGIEVLQLIKKSVSIPVIVLTKMNKPGIRKICLDLGVDAFLTKHMSMQVLKKKIDKLIIKI